MKHLIEISILIIMYAMQQRNHLLAKGKKNLYCSISQQV